jgi:hypothetical protein
MKRKPLRGNAAFHVRPKAWSERGKMLIISTLPQTSTESAVLASPITFQPEIPTDPMDDRRESHRRVVADVERVLDRFVCVDTATALRSPIALWAIHDTRIDRKTAVRKELHSRPEPPVMLHRDGSPMRRVAPLRDVVQIVRVKATRAGGQNRNEIQDDRLEVMAVLKRLQPGHSEALLVASTLRREISHRKAYLRFASTTLGSTTRRKQYTSRQLAEISARRSAYAPELDRFSAALKRVVRTKLYHDGSGYFELQCTLKGIELATIFPRRVDIQ